MMRKVLISVIAMFLLGAVASSPAFAGADKERPLNASLESDFFVDGTTCNDGEGILQFITGSGKASHIGRFTIEGSICLGGTEPGLVTWTAPNGDMINIAFVPDIGEVGPDGSAVIELVAVGTTGTGRFENVSFGPENPVGTVWFYDVDGFFGRLEAEINGGTITYDASDRRG